jgi:hypothetical protein
LQCPVEDVLFGGAAGGGKSDGLLGDFLFHAIEHGNAARGILFRKTNPQLEELISRSKEIFGPLEWVWRERDRMWVSPEGATLKMRYLQHEDDWTNYWGHQYTWQGYDEAGLWATPKPMDKLYARLRSAHGVKCKRRLTANPGGPGHGWLKQRYIDPSTPLKPFEAEVAQDDSGKKYYVERVYIPSRLTDNRILVENDPTYISKLYASGDKDQIRAWVNGDWDVAIGQFFTEWDYLRHVIPEREIPQSWLKFCAFDWGHKTPFCNLWIAVADGNASLGDITPPEGCLVVYREWYGATVSGKGLELTPAEIGLGISSREVERIAYRVADYQIFREDGGPSIAEEMRRVGVHFKAADKQRKPGWQQVKLRLRGKRYGDEDWQPMLLIMEGCKNLIRTLPLMQHDEKDPDDVMKVRGIEDHAAETLRYGCMSRPYTIRTHEVSRKAGLTLNDIIKRLRKTDGNRLIGY